MIFIVSSVILLSFYAFRILEYLLGYFLELVCMKILFYLCWVDIDMFGSFGLRYLLL
jgi:hypothetical protein